MSDSMEINSDKRGRNVLLAVGIIFAAYAFSVVFAGPERVLGRFMVDDALYYFGIARHVAAGDGSCFDGINPTNGYHPLWMLTLTPVHWLFSGSFELAFHACLFLQAVLLMVILWLLASVGKLLNLSPTARAISILCACSPLFFHLWINGLESSLVAVFVLASLRQYILIRSGSDDSLRSRVLLGLFCALAFLSRLDTVFWPLTIIAAEIFDAIIKRRFWVNFYRALAVGAMMLLLGAPYLLHNYMNFGHIMPVSGYMKTPQVSGELARFAVATGGLLWPVGKLADSFNIPAVLAGIVIAAVIAVVAMVAFRRGRSLCKLDGRFEGALAAVAVYMIYCAVHYSYVALAMSGFANTMWYYIPAILGFSLLAGFVADFSTANQISRSAAALILLVAAAFAAGGAWYRFNRPNPLYAAKLDAARWLSENLPGKRGAAFDAGITGYFSGGNVVNLDGLVNNLELKKYADSGQLDQYLRDKQIDYVVQHVASDGSGKRARWIEELDSVLGRQLYSKSFGSSGRMTMYVWEVVR